MVRSPGAPPNVSPNSNNKANQNGGGGAATTRPRPASLYAAPPPAPNSARVPSGGFAVPPPLAASAAPLLTVDDAERELAALVADRTTAFDAQTAFWRGVGESATRSARGAADLGDGARALAADCSGVAEREVAMAPFFEAIGAALGDVARASAELGERLDAALAKPAAKVERTLAPAVESSGAARAGAEQRLANANAKLRELGARAKVKMDRVADAEREHDEALAAHALTRRDASVTLVDGVDACRADALQGALAALEALHGFAEQLGASLGASLGQARAARAQCASAAAPTRAVALEPLLAALSLSSSSAESASLSASSSAASSADSADGALLAMARRDSSGGGVGALSPMRRSRGSLVVPMMRDPSDAAGKLLKQIVVDERSYVSTLSAVANVYRPALRAGMMPSDDEARVFDTLTALYHMHQRLLHELDNALAQWPMVPVGAIFLDRLGAELDVWSRHLAESQRSADTLERCAKQSKALRDMLRDEPKRHAVRPFVELLALPSKRLGHYAAFIKNMLSEAGDEAPPPASGGGGGPAMSAQAWSECVELLQDADELFGGKIAEIESRELMADSLAEVMELSTRIDGCGTLMLPDRRLLAQGALATQRQRLGEDGGAAPGADVERLGDAVFLFNDIALLARKTGAARFAQVEQVPLHRLQIEGASAPERFTLLDSGPPALRYTFTMPKGGAESSDAWAGPFGTLSRALQHLEQATKIFGISLAVIMRREKGATVPQFLEKCCSYIVDRAINDDGIFRLSGKLTQIAALKDQFNLGKKVFFSDDMDANSVAGLIKLWLRELAKPLLTWELWPDFIGVVELDDVGGQVELLRACIAKLPLANRFVLQYLIGVLRRVADNADVNRMSAKNLGVVFAPNVLRKRDATMADADKQANAFVVVQLMIEHYAELFADIERERAQFVEQFERDETERKRRRAERQRQRDVDAASLDTAAGGAPASSSSGLASLPRSPSASGSLSAAAALSSSDLSLANDDVGNVTREGWLQVKRTSRGGGLKSASSSSAWQTRWAVLRYQSLSLFKTKKDAKPKAHFDLTDALIGQSTQKKDFCFAITTHAPSTRTHLLAAKSNQDMLEWKQAIQLSIE
jgi:RhoGAP domain/PH domain/RhoGEF domain